MSTSKTKSIPTKHELCIYELLKAGMSGIHKLGSPQKVFGETCLPTTISELGLKRGLRISRVKRQHIHRAGGKTSFTWYWLADRNEAAIALQILNSLRLQRQAAPIDDAEARTLLSLFIEPAKPAA